MKTPNPEPSEKQLEVYRFIVNHVEQHGFQPNKQEMAAHFGVTKTAIDQRLAELARRGLIELLRGRRERAIVLRYVKFTAEFDPKRK